MKKMTDKQLANKLITKLENEGFTPNEMIKIFRMARKKFENLKEESEKINNKRIKSNTNQ